MPDEVAELERATSRAVSAHHQHRAAPPELRDLNRRDLEESEANLAKAWRAFHEAYPDDAE